MKLYTEWSTHTYRSEVVILPVVRGPVPQEGDRRPRVPDDDLGDVEVSLAGLVKRGHDAGLRVPPVRALGRGLVQHLTDDVVLFRFFEGISRPVRAQQNRQRGGGRGGGAANGKP